MQQTIDALLKMPEVRAATGMSAASVYRLIAQGKFPEPVRLGTRSVAWRSSDIKQWQDALQVGIGRGVVRRA